MKTERKSLGAGEWSEIDGPFERGSGGHNLSTERTSMDQLCQVCVELLIRIAGWFLEKEGKKLIQDWFA